MSYIDVTDPHAQYALVVKIDGALVPCKAVSLEQGTIVTWSRLDIPLDPTKEEKEAEGTNEWWYRLDPKRITLESISKSVPVDVIREASQYARDWEAVGGPQQEIHAALLADLDLRRAAEPPEGPSFEDRLDEIRTEGRTVFHPGEDAAEKAYAFQRWSWLTHGDLAQNVATKEKLSTTWQVFNKDLKSQGADPEVETKEDQEEESKPKKEGASTIGTLASWGFLAGAAAYWVNESLEKRRTSADEPVVESLAKDPQPVK